MVVGAAVLFSTGGAAVKACALSGWQVASFRSGIAAVALLLMVPAARRGWQWRTWVVSLAYAATMVLFVISNKLTTAASTIFLQGAAPLYVLLLSPWLLKERINRRDLMFMVTLIGGMALLLSGRDQASATAPDPVTGNLTALAVGISWALTIMGLRWLGRDQEDGAVSSTAAVVCGNLLACLVCLPLALPVTESTATDWFLVAYLGVLQIAVAYVLLTRGVVRVPALEASLLLLMEPVLSPFWAWLFHDERPGIPVLLGGLIIMTATAVRTWVEGGDR
jgi:drug/metabolite transporter (DMT)-like permease